jgi:hypothetical protein
MRSDAGPQLARIPRALGWLLAALLAAPAFAEQVEEHDMKAAFVFNFAVFTEWPAEALPGAAPISLCASATNPMLAALARLNDKLVNGHKIAVRSSVPLRGCHVLVLDRNDRERWAQIKHDLAAANVLTVSDDLIISADGAVIGLSVENQRIAFDVDMVAARSARLNLSSKLLRLARSVQ